jgi:vitamin B12 transporter
MTRVFVSLAALATATAFASPTAAEPDPVTAATGEAAAGAAELVVTASRSGDAVPADQLGASVTVLDAATLDQRQTRIVSDVLRDVPGLAVSRTGAVGGTTQVRIRGSEGNHVLVLIDGIEVSDPYQGEYDFGTLIADEAARVEVLRGQQSALYGSDAIGGVIQYLTLSGAEAPGLSLRAEGGSFGTFSGGARVAGVAGNLDYALSSSTYLTDGTPTARGGSRDIGAKSVGATGKLSWSPTDTLKVTGVGRYSYTDADSNDTALSGPQFGTIVDTPGARSKVEAYYGLIRAELALADGRWTNALSGQFADTTRRALVDDALSFGNKGRRYKGSFESAFRFGTDRIRHRLTAAVDVEREEFQTLNPVPSEFVFTGRRHTDNVGIVGQYDVVIDDVLAIGGSVRRDENNRFDDTTTYRAQASYRFATGTRVRGAYGTGVKNPGYFDLFGYSDGRYIGNPNLKPEKSKGWEAGVEQAFGGDRATIGATYFDSRLTNEIFTTYPAPDFVATPGNRNTRSTQHGVEVFATAQPIPHLRFDLAYTYLKAREDGGVEIRRPNHIGSVNMTAFSRDESASATLTVRYNGRQQDDAYTDPSYVPVRVSLQEYVLVNLNAAYKLTPRLSVFGRVENLFDERYEEVFSYVGQGRGAYAGVKAAF